MTACPPLRDCCQLCYPRARARHAPTPDGVFIFAFQQGERADAEVGRRWPPTVPAAERNAKGAAELPGRRRWPPAPPIRRDGPGSCARSGKGGIVVNFVTLARARGARRLQTTFSFSFLPFRRASEPTAPKSDGAGRRPCRRRSATPSALPSYRVAAAGRPRPRSAAMAQAAVRAREKGGLLSTLSPSRAREARADSRRRFHFHFCLSAGRASRRRRSRTALADARAGGGAQRQARCRATGSTPLAARAPDPPRWCPR